MRLLFSQILFYVAFVKVLEMLQVEGYPMEYSINGTTSENANRSLWSPRGGFLFMIHRNSKDLNIQGSTFKYFIYNYLFAKYGLRVGIVSYIGDNIMW